MTYEAALKKAKGLKPNIDNCTEYEDAFIFASHADDFSFGGDGPVVILKESGRAINMVDYTQSSKGAKLIREEFTV